MIDFRFHTCLRPLSRNDGTPDILSAVLISKLLREINYTYLPPAALMDMSLHPGALTLRIAPENITDNSLPGIDATDITIGIEIEMAIYGLPDSFPGNIGPHRDYKQMLKYSLKELEKRLPEPHNSFTVKEDPSINVGYHSDGQIGVNAEVVTPILSNNDWEWVIPEMCTAITKAVKAYGGYFDFAPESGTSVHVHVGAKGRHYTLGELKKIAKAIVIFESAMNYHHPVHRYQELTPGMLYYIQSCRESPLLEDLSIVQMVDRIAEITGSRRLIYTINGLQNFPTHKDRCYRYNLCATTKFGTIEFRQAGGSLDGQKISAWVKNAITFLTCAVTVDDENFQNLAIMADKGDVWDEVICEMFALPPPWMQGLPAHIEPAVAGVAFVERIPAPALSATVVRPPVRAMTLDIDGLHIGSGETDVEDEEVGGAFQRRRKRDILKRINARNKTLLRIIRRTRDT